MKPPPKGEMQKEEGTSRSGPYVHPDRAKNFEAYVPNPMQSSQGGPEGDPDGGSSDDEDDEKNDRKMPGDSNKGRSPSKGEDRSHQRHIQEGYEYTDDRNRLGMNGLMRAFIGKPTFGGSWDEDLDNCIGIFDTLSLMCENSRRSTSCLNPALGRWRRFFVRYNDV